MIKFANTVYDLIEYDCGDLDAIYEDYILKQVGFHGLNVLLEHGFIETCGIVNGRRLYVLVDHEPLRYPDEYEEIKAENDKLKERIKMLENYILSGN